MRLLRILITYLAIYPIVSFAADSYNVKLESGLKEKIVFFNYSVVLKIYLSPQDSITLIPVIPNSELRDTSVQLINEPVRTSVDTNTPLINEPLTIPSDSTGLIQMEKKIPGDTSNLLQIDNKIPGDSTGLIKIENISGDSIKIIRKTSIDTVPRYEYRSVYTDTTDIDYKPPRKIIMFKWISDDKRDTVIRYKNIIGFNVFYGIYTYGLGFGIYKRLSNDADFIAAVNLSYVFDRRTSNEMDSTLNIVTLQHESRLYPIVFNVGLEKYFLQNRTDWKIKPVLLFGFTPSVILTTPYDLSLFKSFKKIQVSYGIGIFAALGFDWQVSKKVGINLTARYAFTPVLIGREIYYYKGFLVKNVGGFYVNLGVTLLKEYFGKK